MRRILVLIVLIFSFFVGSGQLFAASSRASSDIDRCVEIAKAVAADLKYETDTTHQGEGVLKVLAPWQGEKIALTMKFYFSDEKMMLASRTSASGMAVEATQKIENQYYKTLWGKLLKEIRVEPVRDFMENMEQLSKY